MQRIRFSWFFLLLFVTSSLFACWGVPTVLKPAGSPRSAGMGEVLQGGLADRVVEHRLENGLQLLMVERHQAPIVSFYIAYRVGGVNESPGMTGVAHLYEHLAFKGTHTIGTTDYKKESVILDEMDRVWDELQNEQARGHEADPHEIDRLENRFRKLQEKSQVFVVRDEMSEIYQRNGGVGLNASTGKDLTRYMVSLPSNRLELWAAIESDRMTHPVLREFYKERDVVLEERRLRYDNSPSGRLYESFIAVAFTAHPYRMPVIGWPSDIRALTRSQTGEFFRTYYGPGNAVIAIVGDIDTEETIRMVERYFGGMPARPDPPRVTTIEPPQHGEKRVEVEFEAEPSVLIGYPKPGLDHPDDAVFDVIDSLLSAGRTSQLYRSLVQDQKLAVSVSTNTGTPGARYPHLFVIRAVPRAPHATEELERAIEAELERLKSEPVEPRDLQKILNQLDAGMIRSLESNSGLASQLSYFHAVAGDWKYLLNNREQVAHVTAEDVMRVAREYFVKKNRVVATLVKKEADREN